MQYLSEQLTLASTNNKPLAILFIDLDGFKHINDSLGHQAGDNVLAAIATRLTVFCDHQCAARWGGDEFIVVLPGVEAETAKAVAVGLTSTISSIQPLENSTISLGATTGIALFPLHCDNANGLIQMADLTMYYQKQRAPGSVGIYSQTLYQQLYHQQSCSMLTPCY